jgi:hypothetical protein
MDAKRSHEAEFPAQAEAAVAAACQAAITNPHQFSLNCVATPGF